MGLWLAILLWVLGHLVGMLFWGLTAHLVGRLFAGLTAPSDSISVYIEPFPRDGSPGNSVM